MWHLLDFLFPPRVDELLVRDMPDDTFLALVAPRLVPSTRPATIALLPFSSKEVRAALHEAKYRGNERAFQLLALALAEYLRDSDTALSSIIIAPTPLGKKRHKERGYNQIEEITRRAVKELRLTIDSTLLERTRETVSQVSLPRDRREENMRGAFRATHVDPACTYVVIDDVLTTGATLQAAIDALREAGATNIIPLALAH